MHACFQERRGVLAVEPYELYDLLFPIFDIKLNSNMESAADLGSTSLLPVIGRVKIYNVGV